ncbi:MAG: hypothetical protein NT030_07615 [Candidatus Saganbacteria bacterium]|nr:hypothetical protein [Candidatus Saganbacteria bacterium]
MSIISIVNTYNKITRNWSDYSGKQFGQTTNNNKTESTNDDGTKRIDEAVGLNQSATDPKNSTYLNAVLGDENRTTYLNKEGTSFTGENFSNRYETLDYERIGAGGVRQKDHMEDTKTMHYNSSGTPTRINLFGEGSEEGSEKIEIKDPNSGTLTEVEITSNFTIPSSIIQQTKTVSSDTKTENTIRNGNIIKEVGIYIDFKGAGGVCTTGNISELTTSTKDEERYITYTGVDSEDPDANGITKTDILSTEPGTTEKIIHLQIVDPNNGSITTIEENGLRHFTIANNSQLTSIVQGTIETLNTTTHEQTIFSEEASNKLSSTAMDFTGAGGRTLIGNIEDKSTINREGIITRDSNEYDIEGGNVTSTTRTITSKTETGEGSLLKQFDINDPSTGTVITENEDGTYTYTITINGKEANIITNSNELITFDETSQTIKAYDGSRTVTVNLDKTHADGSHTSGITIDISTIHTDSTLNVTTHSEADMTGKTDTITTVSVNTSKGSGTFNNTISVVNAFEGTTVTVNENGTYTYTTTVNGSEVKIVSNGNETITYDETSETIKASDGSRTVTVNLDKTHADGSHVAGVMIDISTIHTDSTVNVTTHSEANMTGKTDTITTVSVNTSKGSGTFNNTISVVNAFEGTTVTVNENGTYTTSTTVNGKEVKIVTNGNEQITFDQNSTTASISDGKKTVNVVLNKDRPDGTNISGTAIDTTTLHSEGTVAITYYSYADASGKTENENTASHTVKSGTTLRENRFVIKNDNENTTIEINEDGTATFTTTSDGTQIKIITNGNESISISDHTLAITGYNGAQVIKTTIDGKKNDNGDIVTGVIINTSNLNSMTTDFTDHSFVGSDSSRVDNTITITATFQTSSGTETKELDIKNPGKRSELHITENSTFNFVTIINGTSQTINSDGNETIVVTKNGITVGGGSVARTIQGTIGNTDVNTKESGRIISISTNQNSTISGNQTLNEEDKLGSNDITITDWREKGKETSYDLFGIKVTDYDRSGRNTKKLKNGEITDEKNLTFPEDSKTKNKEFDIYQGKVDVDVQARLLRDDRLRLNGSFSHLDSQRWTGDPEIDNADPHKHKIDGIGSAGAEVKFGHLLLGTGLTREYGNIIDETDVNLSIGIEGKKKIKPKRITIDFEQSLDRKDMTSEYISAQGKTHSVVTEESKEISGQGQKDTTSTSISDETYDRSTTLTPHNFRRPRWGLKLNYLAENFSASAGYDSIDRITKDETYLLSLAYAHPFNTGRFGVIFDGKVLKENGSGSGTLGINFEKSLSTWIIEGGGSAAYYLSPHAAATGAADENEGKILNFDPSRIPLQGELAVMFPPIKLLGGDLRFKVGGDLKYEFGSVDPFRYGGNFGIVFSISGGKPLEDNSLYKVSTESTIGDGDKGRWYSGNKINGNVETPKTSVNFNSDILRANDTYSNPYLPKK